MLPIFVVAGKPLLDMVAGIQARHIAGGMVAGILAEKALHNAGRRKGEAEDGTSLAAEIQAQRMRLDEMKAGL